MTEQGHDTSTSVAVRASPVSAPSTRALTPMQRPLWSSQLQHPAAPTQNMAFVARFDGAIDAVRLAAAFDVVTTEIEALRSRIVERNGATRIALDVAPHTSEIIDLDHSEVEHWARRRIATPIDLRTRSYDSVILRHRDATITWYLALHHCVTDAASTRHIFDATERVYTGGTVDSPSFYDWVEHLHDDARTQRRVARAQAHWKQRRPAPRIGRLYRPSSGAITASTRSFVPLDDELLSTIDKRLNGDFRMLRDDLAWATLLTTATAAHLHHVAGVERFSIGIPIHNRSEATARRVVGTVVEVFPLDIVIEPGQSYRSLHAAVSRSMLDVLAHAVPGTAPAADFAAVVNVIARTPSASFDGVPASLTRLDSGAVDASHLLRVQLTGYTVDDDVALALDVNHGGADADHRRRITAHFASILRTLVAEPDASIGHNILTTDERTTLDAWERGPDVSGDSSTVVDRVRSALASGDQTVITDGTVSLTGRQLLSRADELAEWMRIQGVERGARVGIEFERSPDAVVAILATLLAGGSFVPLDVTHPISRRRDLAMRADCHLVLDSIPQFDSVERTASATTPIAAPSRDDEAYVLFTSGSTGTPKGVPITHGGLVDYIDFAAGNYVDEPPVVALFTSLGFDLTITSLFLPLVTPGARMITIAADGPGALTEIARQSDITWCKATPSHLALLLRMLPTDHALSTLVVGGEAFGSGLARRLLDHQPSLRIFNEYGPTEAVVGCMLYEIEPDTVEQRGEVPIGVPAPGVTLRIVGPELNRVPLGASGELLIHSPGLTAGYLVDTDSGVDAAEAFVELDGLRFYRSGDLVRMDGDTLVYLGRIDEQVKVGGIRLEPTEVEETLDAHPAIAASAVRLWSPTLREPEHRCVRCGLASNVPNVVFDDVGVCSTCHSFDRVAPQAESWFRTEAELREKLEAARQRRTGDYDFLHLLSGGKDSTFALYHMVKMGFRPYVMTLDNGFIAEEAKDNVRRSVAELDLDHEFATTEAMNAIFRDSLERHSNVCHGCYKTIYTLATTRADELGIPLIVTGLSRGQLFETRLIPQQFSSGRFDPDAIDRAVVSARKRYHRLDDGPNRLLDTSVFDSDEVFERIEYLDFYRYVDVELSEMLAYLDTSAPWVRPSDSGRSTNCLINAAGIHNHLREQGYHNYAVPYAWDVRLGHKTRSEAIEELDDQSDLADVNRMLDEVGHTPSPREVLTAWVVVAEGHEIPTPAELRRWVGAAMPKHAVPAAFVSVAELPLSTNGKLDTGLLPDPTRTHRGSGQMSVAPETELEASIIAVWESILQIEPIGVDDDFFALGGDSLAALEMGIAVEEATGLRLSDDEAFSASTPRLLAAALSAQQPSTETDGTATAPTFTGPTFTEWSDDAPPPLSTGELSILFEQSKRPDAVMYNIARRYLVDGVIDADRFGAAVRQVTRAHVPLSWTYGAKRRPIPEAEAADITIATEQRQLSDIDADILRHHLEPFDLASGPLLRVWIQPLTDGRTVVLLVCHHVAADADSFARLWEQIDAAYHDADWPDASLDLQRADYATLAAAQQLDVADAPTLTPGRLRFATPHGRNGDGFLTRRASVSRTALEGRAGSTGFSTALAGIAATLRPYCDSDAVPLSVISSTRDRQTAQQLVGYFLTTTQVAIDCPRGEPIGQIVAKANTQAQRARSAASSAPKSIDGIEVLVAYDSLDDVAFGGRTVSQQVLSNGHAVSDATFFLELRGDHIELSLEYRGTVIDASTAQLLLDGLDDALSAIVNSPTLSVRDAAASTTTTSVLNGPDLAAAPTLLPAIARQFSLRADQPAVVAGDANLTWSDLEVRSTDIAAALYDGGIRRGDPVLVILDRSSDLVATMLAIWRVGGAYVPIDPDYPDERIRLIIETSAATLAVTTAERSATLDTVVAIDVGNVATDRTAPPVTDADGTDTAYIIFTSGSTGTPRGVAVSHAQLSASTTARGTVYPAPPERFLVISSPAFDSSIVGLVWPLATGGTIVLPTNRAAHDPDELLSLFGSHDITHVLAVPTLYDALLQRGAGQSAWPDQAIVAGEACSSGLVERHHRLRPSSALTNEYGPTEASVWATAHHCVPLADTSRSLRDVPIGLPIPGTWIAVVDQHDEPVPSGIDGQLIIGGAGVVDGYLERSSADEAATAKKFGDSRHGHYFRTGDRAVIRELSDGPAIFFRGRIDDQLNVGGARVEPEDIERVIDSDPSVGAVIVSVNDPRSLDELLNEADPGDAAAAMSAAAGADDPARALRTALAKRSPVSPSRLVAHIEPSTLGGRVDVSAIRKHVADSLPATWRPAVYAIHDELPRTPNGKLDRSAAKQLAVDTTPSTDQPSPSSAPKAPHNVDAIAERFALVLGVDHVDPDTSFFDLGGHSLLAMELLIQIELHVGVRVTVSSLYDHPTARELAALVAELGGASSLAQRKFLVPVQTGGTKPPIFGIHVLGANAAFYRPLAEVLGPDQPVFGLGQADLVTDTSVTTDVHQVALGYLEELIEVAPDGPVSLAAVSLGSVVALELAQLLEARGRTVTLVALFDARGPAAPVTKLDLRNRIRAHASEFSRSPARWASDRFVSVRAQSTRRTEIIVLDIATRLKIPVGDRLRIRQFIEGNFSSQRGHQFVPYHGRVVVYRAADDPFTGPADVPGLGWNEVVPSALEVRDMNGAHTTMLEPPFVERLGADLADAHGAALVEFSDSGVPQRVVEASLRGALAEHRLNSEIERWTTDRTSLHPDAAALVDRCDRATRSLAQRAQLAADEAVAALRAGGFEARPGVIGERLQFCAAHLVIDNGTLESGLERLVRLGYAVQGTPTPAHATLVRNDDVATRLVLQHASAAHPAPNTDRTDEASLGVFLATPTGLVGSLLDLAHVTADDVLVDVGCGDGRVLIDAAKRIGCRAIGLEVDPLLAATARGRAQEHAVDELVEVRENDARDADLSAASVIFVFLPATVTAELLESLLEAVGPGGRVVAHEQLSTRWPIAPTASHVVAGDDGVTVAHLWVAT